jgi:hypothetical protein
VQRHGLNGGVDFEPFFFFYEKWAFINYNPNFIVFACSKKNWLIKNIFFILNEKYFLEAVKKIKILFIFLLYQI